MFRSLVTILAITVSTSVFADDLGDQIKARVRAKIAAKLDLSGPVIYNENNIGGKYNVGYASANRSQNLTIAYEEGDITYVEGDKTFTYAPVTTTTTTDSRQWHLREGDRTSTYSPSTREGDVTYAPRSVSSPVYERHVVAPVTTYVPPRLTYSSVLDRPTSIAIRCWAPCGSYFIDAEGRRFILLPTYSKVAAEYRYTTLPGHYWRSSGGTLYYTAAWGTTIRTFQYAGL